MITIIILSIFLVISIFVIVNLLRKLERIDDEIEELTTQVLADLRKLQSDMLEVDSKGAFKSDDEVGQIFEDLKLLINSINDKYVEDTNV